MITTEEARRIADRLLAAIHTGQEGASEILPGVPEFVLDKGYLVGLPSTETYLARPRTSTGVTTEANALARHIADVLPFHPNAATAGVWRDDDGEYVFNLSTWHPVLGDAITAGQVRHETAIWDVKNDCEIRVPKDANGPGRLTR